MKENVIRLANFIMHNLVRILAGIFLLAGVVTISVNSGILMGFKYAYSLEDVNINKLKRGMCVSDVLDYTYGHITSEYGLTGSKEVYVVGIGGKKHQYMLMKKNVSNTFSAFRTEFTGSFKFISTICTGLFTRNRCSALFTEHYIRSQLCTTIIAEFI